jgi:NADPH-dependent 2,4-dienoyl-CoA reductase/sulfur reductase-like enzyme
MATSTHIVVVGSSLAGVRSAEAARRAGFEGRISLVGSEKHFPPVDRPPLSKKFMHDATTGDVLRVAPDLGLDLLLGRDAVALDIHDRRVSLDDGSALGYDGLVIATGASARRLPGTEGRANVHVLRTVEDAAGLRAALRPGVRVAVIGAGVLGCEIAATCRRLELDVTLIDVFSEPMLRILGPSVASIVAGLHHGHGVRLRLGRQVLGLRGVTEADGVVLDHDEVIDADVVVVAIGAAPETRWLEGSGLELADGVVCDSACFAPAAGRTVVAAGDVARWHHPLLDRNIRVEHWTNAVSQGQAAGRNLVTALRGDGDPVPYDVLPYFWTDQYDWKLQFLGMLGEDAAFEEGEPGDRRFVVSYRTEGRLVGVLCANRPNRIPQWRPRIVAELSA